MTPVEFDDHVRRLHARGYDDASMAYILTCSRNRVGRARRRLGLPTIGKGGTRKGTRLSPETRAKLAAAARRRWARPEAEADKARARQTLDAVKRAVRERVGLPERGTAERRFYDKLAKCLGAHAARAAIREMLR